MPWAKILEILDTSMECPPAYGWFHIMFIVASFVAGSLLCCLFKDGQKYAPRVMLITALIVIALEIYKIVNYSFSYTDGIIFSFPWYIFPFQFCSTPMYVGLLAGIIRKGRIHRGLAAYLATYAVFAGLAVMAYPNDVFIETIGVNIQTMICHGSMLTVGIYLYGTGYVPAKFKAVRRALPVFCVAVAIAMGLNEWAYRSGLLENHNFNMFYFSPHQPAHLPLYSNVQNALGVDNPLSFIIYVVGFTAAATVMMLIARLLLALTRSKRKQRAYA